MITRELFIEAIESIKNLKDYNDDKYKLCRKYGADGFLVEPSNDMILLKVIKESFGNCDSRVLQVFCYEKNFGRGKGNQVYIDSDGVKHTISSPDELYDYIISTLGSD